MAVSESAEPHKPLAIFLMGPTASGKTNLAMTLAEHLPVELISVDSALVYQGLDIGSAKPSAEEQARCPHRLLDIRDPAQPYSVAEFCDDAAIAMAEISAAGKVPLLVGGTMMYFKALLDGLADMPQADPSIRAAIEQEANAYGWPYVHEQLRQVDPDTAAEIHPNHSQRLSRALEVYRASGKTMTQLRQAQQRAAQASVASRYQVVQLAIAPRDRQCLHQRITLRFEQMLAQGFADEVRELMQRNDLHADLPAIRAVGYRQMWEHLQGQYDETEMLARGTAATRQLAKRQLTWLRGWPELNWVYTQSVEGELLTEQEIVTQALKFLPKTAI